MTITEKAAYLRGLAEGLELDASQKEVKVINAMLDLIDEMAGEVSELKDNVQNVSAQLDEVDEDLGSLEEEVYGGCSCEDEDDEDEDFGGDECYYEVTCPNCNETICLSEDVICDGQMDCPNCGTPLEFDIDEVDEDDCGCGCGCDHHHDEEE